MDWNPALLKSLIWLGEAFAISMIGSFAAIMALSRFTEWGRRFRRITWAYFRPSRSWLPFAWFALLVFLTLFAVRLNVLFSYWYNGFFSAMQHLDAKEFRFMLIVFGILAGIHVGRSMLDFYLQQAFMVRWRTWLTGELLDRWLNNQAYYRTQYLPAGPDNPDQRIQQDIEAFVTKSVTLATGFLNAVVSVFTFTIILWTLSGTLALFGWEIPRGMVFLVYLYVIVTTVIALKIGRPLIRLNFLKEQFNADFRYALIRLREYGESIAFYRGEAVERANLLGRFVAVIGNVWDNVHRSLKLHGFNFAVAQAAAIFPYVVQAPRLLSKQITLGDVIQTGNAFSQVGGALSFLSRSYEDFAAYRADIDRLTGFIDAIDAAERMDRAQISTGAQHLAMQDLTVRNPAGALLVDKLTLTLSPGSALLIRGKSGSGKTTLLRAAAGLWPHAEGAVHFPPGKTCLFLPQKPYLPLGTLRQALHYPAHGHADHLTNEILQRCQLGHLANHLDVVQDWTRVLSLGEQQRLAIGRILLNAPRFVFLDEASSAMDEGLEYAMYKLLRSTLPEIVLVSVGHRSSLRAFHTHELEILGGGEWQLNTLPAR